MTSLEVEAKLIKDMTADTKRDILEKLHSFIMLCITNKVLHEVVYQNRCCSVMGEPLRQISEEHCHELIVSKERFTYHIVVRKYSHKRSYKHIVLD